MLIGWNGETTPALSLGEEMEVVASAGYGGLEIFIPKLPPYLQDHTVDDLAQALRQNRLAPLALNGIERINLRSRLEFEEIKKECRELSALSQKIGCPTIVVVPSPRPEGMPWEQIKEQTVPALQELADEARPYGVKLAFEFLAPADCSVQTLAQGWEVVREAGRDNLGLVIDTYHFYVGGSSWESLEEFDVERLLLVHINDVEPLPFARLTDAHRLLPGEGVIPLERIFSSLYRRGYRGAYSLEVMRPAYRERQPHEYAGAGLVASRKALDQAGVD